MNKFYKTTFWLIGLFIFVPLIIGFFVTIRKALKNMPPDRTAIVRDSIQKVKDSIGIARVAATQEAYKPKNWYYWISEDKMTSDTVFMAQAEPIVSINIRTDREITNVSVVEDNDGYRKGYENGYRNAKGKSSRYSSYSSGSSRKRTTVSSTNYAPAGIGITLTKRPGRNAEVYVDMNEGSFFADYFTGQRKLRIRFDKDKATFYTVTGDAASTGRTLFISQAGAFIERLKKAEAMLVELYIVDNNPEVLEFDVHGLKWNHP